MLADSLLCQSACSLNECLDGADVSTGLVHAGTEDGTNNLRHVLIAYDSGIDSDGVLVHQSEIVHIELADVEHRVLCACLAVDADGLSVGIASETAGIAEQGGGALVLLHLIEHGALHLTGNAYQRFVRTYGDDVVVLQTDITCQLAIQQEGIDVDT